MAYVGRDSYSSDWIKKLKSSEWDSSTDESGFSALPGGYLDPLGVSKGLLSTASFLTSTPNKVISFTTYHTYLNWNSNIPYLSVGASLRCMKN
jgi:hypothetical protein